MAKGWIVVIGAWIAIKTATSWGGWQRTRTAYNRFLLGNILSLSASFSIYKIFFIKLIIPRIISQEMEKFFVNQNF